MGPEATLFKRVGFAASMNKPELSITGMQPRIGIAAAMYKYEDDLAALEISPKKRQARREGPMRPNHSWPDVRVSRRIDMANVDAEWRKFHSTMAVRQGKRVGRVAALKELECVYISPREMNNALTERYAGPSKKSLDSERTKKSRDVVRQMNNFQAELGEQYEQMVIVQALSESVDLGLHLQDPDNQRWQSWSSFVGLEQFMDQEYLRDNGLEYVAEQVSINNRDRLWVSGQFTIDGEEGCGPQAYGFRLEDERGIMATERQELVSGFCSRFKLNPKHFSADWTPRVVLVDTAPHNVADLRDIIIPALPITVPLHAPRAFVT